MSRHFVDQIPDEGQAIRLSKKEQRHIEKVLRLSAGEEIILFDGCGTEAQGRLVEHSNGGWEVLILGKKSVTQNRQGPRVWLFCALIKGERLEWIAEKLTELDTHSIIFFEADRSERKSRDSLIPRLRSHIESAGKQSGRSDLPHLYIKDSLTEALELIPHPSSRFFFSPEADNSISSVVEYAEPDIIGLIGPEGGWSPAEHLIALSKEFVPVSLGPLILRTDTAALYAAAILKNMRAAP